MILVLFDDDHESKGSSGLRTEIWEEEASKGGGSCNCASESDLREGPKGTVHLPPRPRSFPLVLLPLLWHKSLLQSLLPLFSIRSEILSPWISS